MADLKMTKAQMAEVIRSLSQANADLLKSCTEHKAENKRLVTQAANAKAQASNTEDALFRLRKQASAVTFWAEKYHKDKPVLVHVIQAVLFTPGGGVVHPFARWDYPGLELVR